MLLLACVSPPPASVPINIELANRGVSLSRTLPAVLPGKAVPVPHSQFVLIPAESAVGILMPIPFVSEVIGSAIDRSDAADFELRFGVIAPYRIALEEMKNSPLYKANGGALTLLPFVFMTECIDDNYRLALVFQLQGDGWTGRYMYHLPTAYPISDLKSPSPSLLASLQGDLMEGAKVLRNLLERGARGDLAPSGVKADIGSLHLVGGRAAGLMSPTIFISKGADVIEEAQDHVVVRMPGDMSNLGTAGGLFFGVHYLRKEQLYTFKKL